MRENTLEQEIKAELECTAAFYHIYHTK